MIVVTVTNKLFILDSLCHTFNIILPHHTDTSQRKKVFKLRPSKSIGQPADADQNLDLLY